jgi:hypothetical protein
VTAAGDVGLFISLGSGSWKCAWYSRADGLTAKQAEVLLEVQTASSSATIDFVLTSHLNAYRAFKVVMYDVRPGTDTAALWLRTSTDGGSSYDAGASDYGHARAFVNDSGAPTDAGSPASTSILLSTGLGNAATESLNGQLTLMNPSGTAYHKLVISEVVYINDAGVMISGRTAGRRASTADVDAIRLMMSSGNIATGTFALYGIR